MIDAENLPSIKPNIIRFDPLASATPKEVPVLTVPRVLNVDHSSVSMEDVEDTEIIVRNALPELHHLNDRKVPKELVLDMIESLDPKNSFNPAIVDVPTTLDKTALDMKTSLMEARETLKKSISVLSAKSKELAILELKKKVSTLFPDSNRLSLN